ncbi:MAG: hypothetical protein PUF12_04945 [Thermoflexaceae bacterium]|nr:hypothetical protein [Thermoflexaceae bacterium]
MYQFVIPFDEIMEMLNENILFCSSITLPRKLNEPLRPDRDMWKFMLEELTFGDVLYMLLEEDMFHEPLGFFPIVFCMHEEYNKEKYNLEKIYNLVDYKPHGNEQAVFFVDTSVMCNRTDGILFTTKAIYRKSKGVIKYEAMMPVRVTDDELYVKNTIVLSKVFVNSSCYEDICDLFQIVYIFNCLRYPTGSQPQIYNKKTAIDDAGNPQDQIKETGVGMHSSTGMLGGILIWVVIIILIVRGCGA